MRFLPISLKNWSLLGPGLALIEEVMNPTQLSEQDKSQIDNRAMDFGIGPGIFIKLLKSDRFYLDEKRQAQQDELEIAASQQGKYLKSDPFFF